VATNASRLNHQRRLGRIDPALLTEPVSLQLGNLQALEPLHRQSCTLSHIRSDAWSEDRGIGPISHAGEHDPLPSVQAAFVGRLHSWWCPSINFCEPPSGTSGFGLQIWPADLARIFRSAVSGQLARSIASYRSWESREAGALGLNPEKWKGTGHGYFDASLENSE
jgi:hypothetical protein